MLPEIIIAVTLTVIGVILSYWTFRKGVALGQKRLLDLFLKSGYEAKVKAFREQNRHVEKGGIAFVGDSITQDYPVNEYFFGKTVYNRGIGGDTTEGLLKRLDESVFDLEPRVVVLLIGTNDFAVLGSKPDIVAVNLLKIVTTIREKLPDVGIYLESVYPVNEKVDPFSVSIRKNTDIRELNRLLAPFEAVTYVDLWPTLADKDGRLQRDYTPDGLHLNEQGYRQVTEILADLIPQLH